MNPLTIRPDRLRRLRRVCLSLPETAEKEAWGDPTWRVRDRIFAMQKGNYAGGRPSLWLKVSDVARGSLIATDPRTFFVPPYVGHKGWVGVYVDGPRVDWGLLATLVEESYRLIAPKRLAVSLSGSAAAAAARVPAASRRARRGSKKARPSD